MKPFLIHPDSTGSKSIMLLTQIITVLSYTSNRYRVLPGLSFNSLPWSIQRMPCCCCAFGLVDILFGSIRSPMKIKNALNKWVAIHFVECNHKFFIKKYTHTHRHTFNYTRWRWFVATRLAATYFGILSLGLEKINWFYFNDLHTGENISCRNNVIVDGEKKKNRKLMTIWLR